MRNSKSGRHLNVNPELALRKRFEEVHVDCDDVVHHPELFSESEGHCRLLWIALRRTRPQEVNRAEVVRKELTTEAQLGGTIQVISVFASPRPVMQHLSLSLFFTASLNGSKLF